VQEKLSCLEPLQPVFLWTLTPFCKYRMGSTRHVILLMFYEHSSPLGICGLIKSPFLREKAGRASLLSQKWGFYFLASPLVRRFTRAVFQPDLLGNADANAFAVKG